MAENPRVFSRIPLESKDKLDKVCEWLDVSANELVKNLVCWYLDQDRESQVDIATYLEQRSLEEKRNKLMRGEDGDSEIEG